MVIYAMAPTSGLAHAKAAAIARFLDFAAGAGQTPGLQPGQLAPGYLPLTAALRAETRKAATDVANQTGNTGVPGSNPGGGGAAGGRPPRRRRRIAHHLSHLGLQPVHVGLSGSSLGEHNEAAGSGNPAGQPGGGAPAAVRDHPLRPARAADPGRARRPSAERSP